MATFPIKVTLHTEYLMTDTIKYRDVWNNAPIFTTEAVNNGNFSNKNLFCDNVITLGGVNLGTLSGTDELYSEANYIKLEWNDYVVIGYIIDWEYLNDNNIKIAYTVDCFTSALASGIIRSMGGLCERTNLSYTGNFVNLQSEPFSPSDVTVANPTLTQKFNEQINQFENITYSEAGISSPDVSIILTVSPALAERVGATPFSTPTAQVGLKDVTTLNFYGSGTTEHSGGTYRGIPLKFDTIDAAQTFIKTMLSGSGFRCKMPAAGYSTQESKQRRTMLITSDNGGQIEYSHKNWNYDDYECLRFITGNDFFGLYAIPKEFATAKGDYFEGTYTIEGFRQLSSTQWDEQFHHMGVEIDDKARLLAYPYCYTKIVTANGDTINIQPQSMHKRNGNFDYSPSVYLSLRYVGGDTPRLMGSIAPSWITQPFHPYRDTSVCEWFTIRSYPSLSMGFSDSRNQQAILDAANIKKLLATDSTQRNNAGLFSSFDRGFHDGAQGEFWGTETNKNHGWTSRGIAGAAAGLGWVADAFGAGNSLANNAAIEMQNAVTATMAGNVITPNPSVVMGNDMQGQLTLPAISAFRCGATDAELFAFCRYLDTYGHACNCMLQPLDNQGMARGGLFDGNATVTPVAGMTFYKFSNIIINGAMPNEWRTSIKMLFESGVYLRDSV